MVDLSEAESVLYTGKEEEFPFEILSVGQNTSAELIFKHNPNILSNSDIFMNLANFGSLSDFNVELEDKYLTPKRILTPSLLNHAQRVLEVEQDYSETLNLQLSKNRTDINFKRNILTGKINFETDFNEVMLNSLSESNPKNSTSLQRDPAGYQNFVTGKSTNYPFTPGGIDFLQKVKVEVQEFNLDDLINEEEGLLTIAPGFERGLETMDEGKNTERKGEFFSTKEYTASLATVDDDILNFLTENVDSVGNGAEVLIEEETQAEEKKTEEKKEVDDIIPTLSLKLPKKNKPVISSKVALKEWAHMIDVNLDFPDFHDLVPDMAFSYPFELDIFQKQAVYHLEQGDSVFVAAHTSAGKTVVAEYAIALAQKHFTKAIYTSPIKALSNQKFRDFKNTFENVGILTGDVQINPEASCLVMTTEILRSMLYRGADLIRDVEFVIFDEVHYINDSERGVVWEEVIIMLPDHVSLILLSATIPNTKEFADWVGRTKKKNIYVISTLKRPVPLEHYIYYDSNIYKIVDSSKKFLPLGYKNASDALNATKKKEIVKKDNSANTSRGGRGGRGGQNSNRGRGSSNTGNRAGSATNRAQTDKNLYVSLIATLKKLNLLPVIIFTFSKKKCEEYCAALSNFDLTSGSKEKSEIHLFCEKSLSRLKGLDRELPQVLRTKEHLLRGIAVHHSGLLPIIKEMVEILFTRGLVKLLFATETFAMGVNAPAKAVVYSGIRKHDGQSFRDLLPGEYTQMSGRAGRRGLDTTGMVLIACSDEIPESLRLNKMLLGTPTKLESQFRLTYNMILNLLRVEALKIEDMIKRSFSENSNQKLIPEQEEKFKESSKRLAAIKRLNCNICDSDIDEYYDVSAKITLLNHELREMFINTPIGNKALCTGRVVIINNSFYRNSIGVLLPKSGFVSASGMGDSKSYTVFILCRKREKDYIPSETGSSHTFPLLFSIFTEFAPMPVTSVDVPMSGKVSHDIISIPYTDLSTVTKYEIKLESNFNPEVRSQAATVEDKLLQIALEIMKRKDTLEFDWDKIRNIEFQEKKRDKKYLLSRLTGFDCVQCPELIEHYAKIHMEHTLQQQVLSLGNTISDQNLELLPDYFQRIDVLKYLKFIDESSTIQMKGRVACEINTADELVLTELILDNFFAEFEPPEMVALLSCFVFQEKSQSKPNLTPNLERGIEKIQELAIRIAEIQKSCGLDIAQHEALGRINLGLVEVIYEWANGLPFKHITALTDVLEGSIVRCIVRLEETCREVRGASRIIGDAKLYKKMEICSEAIKRDIVFAASFLYTNIPSFNGGLPFFGNFFQFLKFGKINKLHDLFKEMNKDESIVTYSVFFDLGISTSKAELVKGILNSKSFVRDDFAVRLFDGISKYSLFVIPTSDLWKKHRKMIQPAFAPVHLERTFHVTMEVCERLFEKIGDIKHNVPMHQYFNYISCDVIGKIAFSYDFEFTSSINNVNDPKYNVLHQFESINDAIGLRFAAPKPFWNFIGAYPMKGSFASISETIQKILEEKKKRISEHKSYADAAGGMWEMDVLDRLLENSYDAANNIDDDKKPPFTDEELCDEIFGLFLAGHETTSNSLGYMLLEITRNPLVEKKLKQEIDLAFNNITFTYQKLPELKYLDCFIKESLRYHPVLPGLTKVADRDDYLGEYYIKKGTPVTANIICIHFNELYWKNPNVFSPERWENNFTPVTGSYVPFGDGPHNCVGQKLALIEMKVVLSVLLRNYEFTTTEGQTFEGSCKLTMSLKDGILINLKKRILG
ncbi:hypothetical protein HK099_006031 [Clydaea vesicula]|uniref:Uncharacterized protein n=1 Tax=Clydaea vesicula TaxID=447962 RepID=A0AAD5U8C0_9FUNG|nr:hypothetical protein HK099_006031 [Clydaea vesicula]